MNRSLHKLYLATMTLIVVGVTLFIGIHDTSYYSTALEERFYHPDYNWFNPSGIFGHGLGIIGSLMILFGVLIYIVRKHYLFMARFIRLKYLLEFHIFLCTLGPVLVLYHTTFKFGGLVSIAFWSMAAVVLSGVIGRYIYIQIPRNIDGRELSLAEIRNARNELLAQIENMNRGAENLKISESESREDGGLASVGLLKEPHSDKTLSAAERKKYRRLSRQEFVLAKRIKSLNQMQKLFKYWHVAHKPFALIMLVIVIIHIAVTLLM